MINKALKNIEEYVDCDIEISIGRFGPVSFSAVATDEGGMIAALVKKPDETLEKLLQRLDLSIEKALEEGVFTDETNN